MTSRLPLVGIASIRGLNHTEVNRAKLDWSATLSQHVCGSMVLEKSHH